MARSGKENFDLSAADLDLLADMDLNGFDMENIIQCAELLVPDGEQIGMGVFDMLLRNRWAAFEHLLDW